MQKPRWMRRPRAGLVSRHSGDAGLRPGALQTPCQELADAEPPRLARDMDAVAPARGRDPCRRPSEAARRKARIRHRKEERRQWSAERRPRCPKGSADYARLVRLEALHSPRIVEGAKLAPPKRGMEGGLPGASNNTGGGALAKGCLTIEDGERRAGEQHFPLIPAQAGIQGSKTRGSQQRLWVPACAGTSGGEGRATRTNTPLFAAIAACYHRPSA